MTHAATTLEALIRSLSFRLVQPGDVPRSPKCFELDREGREPATLLELPGAPFDEMNTELPEDVRGLLRPLLAVPRMSTLAMAAVINRAVACMRPGEAFVNVGTWHGFTLLAAMAGNPDAICVGIDDFSEFGGPREESGARFEAARSERHSFHEMDYREYLAEIHEGPIGVYLYDGADSYEAEFEALVEAERFFADDCVLIADDANHAPRRQAMLDFVAGRPGEYGVVADIGTGAKTHPTFWNGLLVVRRGDRGEPLVMPKPQARPPSPGSTTARPTVTLVVLDRDGNADQSAAVESAHAQTWPDVEVLVADSTRRAASAALADALAWTAGSHVAFANSSVQLREDAVELCIAFPDAARFWHAPLEGERLHRLHTGLAAGADIDSVLSPGTPFLFAGDPQGIPQTMNAGPRMPLAGAPWRLRNLGDDEVLRALRDGREAGARHLAVLWMRFDWLEQRPGLTAHLTQDCTTLLDNERVRVFALDGADRQIT
jgi:hypothetical protein